MRAGRFFLCLIRGMRCKLLVVIVLGMTLAHRAAAQASHAASCTFDTAAHHGLDTVLITLASGSRIGNKPELRDEYLVAADAIRRHYRAPERVGLRLWARLVGDSRPQARDTAGDAPHGFDGEVRFGLDPAGRLANDSIAVETLNDDLAESVAAAIRRADSAGAFAPPSAKLLKDRGMIRLHFVTPRPGSDRGAPLLRVIVPTVRLDRSPSMKSSPRIQYPDGLRRANISGRVLLQFVLGSDGRPILSTLSIMRGEYGEFVMAAVEAVPAMRFTPGRVDNCDVPVLVRVPIDFKVRY